MTDALTDHWQTVYLTKPDDGVSWFEPSPTVSLELIVQTGINRASVIDIGGGASRLVDALIANGHRAVAVLDLSAHALKIARSRLGAAGEAVEWIVGDVTQWQPVARYDIWHDRAAFHFLMAPDDRIAYARAIDAALRPGGTAIIGTFALDGPEQCSGLPVMRHDAESLGCVLGVNFSLTGTRHHDHQTPGGTVQKFQFSSFRKVG
jgi:SAM-dependent methyltransferase